MTLDSLRDSLPAHAQDIKLNLSSLMGETVMTEQQRVGTLLASAIAAREPSLIRAAEAEAAARLSSEAAAAARTAAALMAMNNIYYRFVHLTGDADYKTLPARLRMNALAKPGVDKVDFELWCLAVSAINGCGMCLDAHERALRAAGVAREVIQASVRLAAVIHAAAVTLNATSVSLSD